MKTIFIIFFCVFFGTATAQTNQNVFDTIDCQTTTTIIQTTLNQMDSIIRCKGDLVLYSTGKMAVFQVHLYNQNGIKIVINGQLWEDWNPEMHKLITNISGQKEVEITGKLERSAYKKVVYRYAECEQLSVYFKIDKFKIL